MYKKKCRNCQRRGVTSFMKLYEGLNRWECYNCGFDQRARVKNEENKER